MNPFEGIADFFGSKIKALEIAAVIHGNKPAARIMINQAELGETQKWCGENSLASIASDFKVRKQDTGRPCQSPYSDKGAKIPKESLEDGYFFLYLAKEQEKAEEAKLLEQDGKHKELGIALGYPECCSAFFEKNFPEQSKHRNDFTLLSLGNSSGFQFPWQMNITARHFDISLLSHFPCSFRCSHSLEIAKQNFSMLSEHGSSLAAQFESEMKTAAIYTDTQGVVLLKSPILEGSRLSYDGINATQDNQLSNLLRNAEFLTIEAKGRIVINGLKFTNIGLMVFS
ncbi:hypothetical protein HYV84_04880 [Candidatus Woesearchaeota archaeon]|nr:hypothetical protein [Candidatus Woesearchaeota archaeon]